jgi:hypothetical protein
LTRSARKDSEFFVKRGYLRRGVNQYLKLSGLKARRGNPVAERMALALHMQFPLSVIPAQAGIHDGKSKRNSLGSRVRGNDATRARAYMPLPG